MKTANIKSVQPSGNFKELFMFEVELDNGDTGNIYKKSINPGLELGQSVTYTINDKGTIKIQRDIPNQYTQNVNTDDRQELIVKQSCLKAAVEFCDKNCTIEHIIANAEVFYNWVRTGEKPKATKEDLPF